MTYERQGYPSASSMERLKLCPGSHQLIASLPERPRKEDAWTTAGTEAHEELASDAETENLTVETCREIAVKFLDTLQIPNDSRRFFEERLWGFKNDPSLKFSGKPDYVVTWKSVVDYDEKGDVLADFAAIIDWKTGRKGAPDAAENLQLRTLAVLVDANYGPFETITVAAVQPWVAGQITVAKYERAELIDAEREIVEIIQESQKPDAPRRPGPRQCEYCPARAFCDEVKASTLDMPSKVMMVKPGSEATISGEQMASLLGRVAIAKKVIKDIEAEAKWMLSVAPTSVPGYAIKTGNMVRRINDIVTVKDRLAFRGVHPNEVDRKMSISFKAIAELLEEEGYTGKANKEQVAEVLDGCTESKPTAARLVRVDGKELE